jgi:hypothetical protein
MGIDMNKLVTKPTLLRAEASVPATTGHGNQLPITIPDWDDVAIADLPAPEMDAPMEFIETYNAIGRQLGHIGSPIVQFVAARPNEGGAEVAYGVAWAGASLLGQRVLFVHASDEPVPATAGPHMPTFMTLNDVAAGRADIADALVKRPNVDLHLAVIRRTTRQDEAFAAGYRISNVLRALRNGFNCIIIAPGPANRDPLSAILTKVVDGSILVVRAESTTTGSAKRMRDLLSSGGTPVLGAVLNRQKHHMPGWMSRWF